MDNDMKLIDNNNYNIDIDAYNWNYRDHGVIYFQTYINIILQKDGLLDWFWVFGIRVSIQPCMVQYVKNGAQAIRLDHIGPNYGNLIAIAD